MKVMAAVSPLFYGPFYLLAIFAFITGKEWIRIPGLLWAWGCFLTVAAIILEEWDGDFPSPDFHLAALANAPYCIVPLFLIARLWGAHPFTVKK